MNSTPKNTPRGSGGHCIYILTLDSSLGGVKIGLYVEIGRFLPPPAYSACTVITYKKHWSSPLTLCRPIKCHAQNPPNLAIGQVAEHAIISLDWGGVIQKFLVFLKAESLKISNIASHLVSSHDWYLLSLMENLKCSVIHRVTEMIPWGRRIAPKNVFWIKVMWFKWLLHWRSILSSSLC